LRIIKTTQPIQTKFCTVTDTTKKHFVGGPNTRITNPRWRTAAILKNCKRPYLLNGSTDLHKIWYNHAFGTSKGYGQLKFPSFKNPRWRKTAILKNRKRLYLRNALTDVHKIWHDNAFWPPEGYEPLKF